MERWNPEQATLAQGLPPLTAKQIIDAERDCVYIFNVSPRQHGPIMVNGRNYTIPARPEGEEVSAPLKINGTVFGEEFKRTINVCTNEFARTQEDGVEVAKKLLGVAAFCKPDQNLIRWGVFYSSSLFPSRDEVEAAKAEWHDRCSELVDEARGLYSVNNGMVSLGNGRLMSNIATQHRVAAKELGVEQSEPWAGKTVQMTACNSCGVSVRPGVAFCTNGCIVDEAKARQARPWLFAEEKRGPGRPVGSGRQDN